MEKSVNKITKNWGGPFEIKYEKSWKKVFSDFSEYQNQIRTIIFFGLLTRDTESDLKQ